MIYTEEKERSHRFALALRMGLPIFFLLIIAFFGLFTQPNITFGSLIVLSILLLGIMVYFLFYLIYQSERENITDPISHTFTPEYFFNRFLNCDAKQTKTAVMVVIENLTSINEQYGIQNGNKILWESVKLMNQFFTSKGIEKLPVCRFKGGDFILIFEGDKDLYIPTIELFKIIYKNHLIDEIEVNFEAVYVDTKTINDKNELITRLYETYMLQKREVNSEFDEISEPAELEIRILEALDKKRCSIGVQEVRGDNESFFDTTVKLVDLHEKLIHQNNYLPFLNRIGKLRILESSLLEKIVEIAERREQKFSITISPVTMRNPIFFQHALRLLQDFPKAKQNIVLIIDEKEYTPNIKRFIEQISQYRAVGYNIALNHYGSNHTTMLYLKEIEVDYIRFDSLYSRHIKEERYQNLLRGLNMIAHLMKVKSWIGMIEDAEAAEIAKEIGIDCIQGNYLAKITTLE